MSPLNRTSARRGAFAAGSLAVALATTLTACGGPDLSELRSGPIPEKEVRLDPKDLPPEPGDDAPLDEKVEWELLKETAEYAREFDPDATAECPAVDAENSSDITCTVGFEGVDAKWEVSVTPSFVMAGFEMKPKGRQVVRSVVEDLVRRDKQTEAVRCDMDEVQLVGAEGAENVTCVWGRDKDSGVTSEREGVVELQAANPVGGDGFWLSDRD